MKSLFSFVKVDSAIAYALLGRCWGLVSGIVTLLFVSRYLGPNEQGFFYTFVSLMAVQIFFELGMSVVVVQFASHEMAKLSWINDSYIFGDYHAKCRLRSLLILIARWYFRILLLFLIVAMPLGILFFSYYNPMTVVSWMTAWIWLVTSASLNMFLLPFVSLLEGCGRVTEITRFRMYQGVLSSLSGWAMLASDQGLLAMPVVNSVMLITLIIWLWRTKKTFFVDLLSCKTNDQKNYIDWRMEIWPLQWRISLSFMSGFFIFQLFTPILFAYRGAVEAGQMGMSFSIANALLSIPIAWMGTKSPSFGMLIAKNDYISLNYIFNKAFSSSLVLVTIIGFFLCVFNYWLHLEHIDIASRLLAPFPFVALIIATILNFITYAQSTYLRAHKQEPFLSISLISAALTALLAFPLGKNFGAEGLMSAYLIICFVVGFGWGSLIFFTKKQNFNKLD